MFKIIALTGGLAGAAGLSQYPEFAQQYTQRLAGQVDALTAVVADFEASAMRSGLTRTQAFEQMTGTQFLADRQADMRRTFARHAVLSDNLATLRETSAMSRLTMPLKLTDVATFESTWADFRPAVPLSGAGIVAAGAGGVAGWGITAALLALIVSFFRRAPKVAASQPVMRKEPALRKAPEPEGAKPNLTLVGRR